MKSSPEKQIISRYDYSQEFKDQVVFEVLYEGRTKEEVTDHHGLSSVQTVTMWIHHYKPRVRKGAITLPPMTAQQKDNLRGLQKRLKEMERALDEANVLILGLNAMIDMAEDNFNIPIRKKGGTKR